MSDTRPGSAGVGPQPVPLIDLQAHHRPLQPQLLAALQQVLDSGAFVMGPNVLAFEEEAAQFFGARHAIGVASGTDALMLSMAALGVKREDEVLVPSFTYAATAAAVCHLGARPVFVDSLPDGFNLDPEDAARRITPRTRAIIPVHLYGEAAPMDQVLALAEAHKLHVVEDVAQAAGGRHGSRMLGTLGAAGCFSFYPTKNLAGCGDAGMVITDDPDLAQRLRLLRQQADASILGGEKYHHPLVGYNSRLDELQAAILRIKLPYLEAWNRKRIDCAQRYQSGLAGTGLKLPLTTRDGSHVYCLFTVRTQHRDRLRRHLTAAGIGSAIYYPLPLHLQEAYRSLGAKQGDFPVAERLAREVLSIPVYPELTNDQLDRIVEAIVGFVPDSPGGAA